MEITKELLKQMKDARCILIYRDRTGCSQMSLLFEDSVRGQKVDTRLEYLTDTSLKIYAGYKEDGSPCRKPNYEAYCCAHVDYLQSRGPARTAIQSLRIGDDITFEFIGRNNNQYVENAELCNDEVRLLVKRSNGNKWDEYLLDHTTSRRNSARMIDEDYQSGLSPIDPHSYKLVNRKHKELIIAEPADSSADVA